MSVTRHDEVSFLSNSDRSRIRPKKRLGQHFLRDRRILSRMADVLKISSGDQVIEIGPGTGLFTKELISRGPNVIGVELDSELANDLPKLVGHAPNLSVVNGDARLIKPTELLRGSIPYKLTGNLPYYAAMPIIRNFLEDLHPPSLVVVTVQKEVAQNMIAKPGRMSLLSIAIQLYSRVEIMWYLSPEAFYPRPKVVSAVVKLEPLTDQQISVSERERFFHLIRGGFCAPRKQLGNAIGIGLGLIRKEAHQLLISTGIDPSRRAGSLSLHEWMKLYRVWKD